MRLSALRAGETLLSGGRAPERYSLEEVLLAVDAAGPGEAAVGQLHLAIGTLEAGAVPVPVQDLEDEPVHDVLVAAGAQRDLCGEAAPRQPPPRRPRCLPRPDRIAASGVAAARRRTRGWPGKRHPKK